MDKKDIYEHLAQIYLDTPKEKKKVVVENPRFRTFFFTSVTVVCCLVLVIFFQAVRHRTPDSQVALVLYPDVIKINFNFDPAKKEVYSVNLNTLDLSRYKALAFSCRTGNPANACALKIALTNTFKETAETYIRNIPSKWNSYSIDLADLKHISDWTTMATLNFIIEEWNSKEKHDELYIENIRFVR